MLWSYWRLAKNINAEEEDDDDISNDDDVRALLVNNVRALLFAE